MAETTVNEPGVPSRPLANLAHALPGPLNFERVGNSWEGAKVTNTEAMKLVSEVRKWAAQFEHDDAKALCGAMDDMKKLFIRVWTEIDESLLSLSAMNGKPEMDAKHLADAMGCLNRWQDRGGRIGNVRF